MLFGITHKIPVRTERTQFFFDGFALFLVRKVRKQFRLSCVFLFDLRKPFCALFVFLACKIRAFAFHAQGGEPFDILFGLCRVIGGKFFDFGICRCDLRPRPFERLAVGKIFRQRGFVLFGKNERRRRFFKPHDRAVKLFHARLPRLELFHFRKQFFAFRTLFIECRNRPLAYSILFERFANALFFDFETGYFLLQCFTICFCDLFVLFEPRFQHAALFAQRGEFCIDAFDQPFAVFFEIEQPRNEFEPFRSRRFDELREFPLRQGNTFFKIALFKPHDPQQQRVALAHAFGKSRKRFARSLVHTHRLHGVFTLDFAFDAEGAPHALVIYFELEIDISLIEPVIDNFGKTALRARHVAVKSEGYTVEHGALARAGIAEDPENAVFGERSEIDLRAFGKGIYPAKFKTFRFHRSPLRAPETP